ncbi:uncharacterized protein H6S33_009264 [Morchella sextelata]|uniref:uncharacterized protein n=1 Tax=Morchella sextelata TaxID=1174677 RepID=UPI001D04F3D5|nr:uncharacterized protein H6S33_009264 [Morchella sextelata]KAH0612884.1 hypothetical protein H6S33_009264 [Morchella sextelata]
MADSTKTPESFADLGIDRWLVDSLGAMAIRKPTAIQAACIQPILEGKDCIGGSRTGSGKTIAFAAPILHRWSEDPTGIFALILTPTRELALQIAEQLTALGAPQNLKICLLIGGTDMRAQAIALATRPHIVIATPGRLADHIRSSGEDTVCGLRRVRFVVLDEADRLLSETFASDLEECLGAVPPAGVGAGRQTLLFTATVTEEVRALKEMERREGRREVFVCEVDTEKLAIPATLTQRYMLLVPYTREAYLHTLLSTPGNEGKSAIIFTNRTATANLLTHTLKLLGHRVTPLHSELPQRERTDSLGRFRAEAARILVATDVASRGLDIPVVELVVNFDVPRDPDDYIHRVGRTARAGKKGEAITFVTQYDIKLVEAIEQRTGKKMEEYVDEPGVSLEGRVVRETLQEVSEKRRMAKMDIEEGRNENGKRKRKLMDSANGMGRSKKKITVEK